MTKSHFSVRRLFHGRSTVKNIEKWLWGTASLCWTAAVVLGVGMGAGLGGSAFAQAAAKKNILVIGDSDTRIVGTDSSKVYFDAAVRQLSAVANVQQRGDLQPSAQGNSVYSLQPSDLLMADGSKYDAIVLLATYAGISEANRAVIESAILQRSAESFFLFPDQCSGCAANVDQITLPWIQSLTGWTLTNGEAIGKNANSGQKAVFNADIPSVASNPFKSIDPLNVWDYMSISGVPADNVLYMPGGYPVTPDAGGLVKNVAALVVPRSAQKQNACVFVISDVNPWVFPNNPTPNPALAQAIVNASDNPMCSAGQEGSITVEKTLVLPAEISGPIKAQFTANCSLNGVNASYMSSSTSLNAGTQSISISNIPAGSSCVVTESVDPAPAGYAWTSVLPASPFLVTAGQSVTAEVTNTLALIPPTVGSIRVNKTLTLNGQVAQTSMQFTATCDLPSAGSTYTSPTLNMSIDGTKSVDIDGIPAGANCTLSESLSPPPANFFWQQNVPSAAITVAAGSTVPVAVTNTLNPVPAGTGVIRVTKTLATPGEVTEPFSFQFSATCESASFTSQTMTMVGQATAQSIDIPNVPLNVPCTVSEQLPSAPTNYLWTTVPNQSATVAASGTPATVAFANELQRGVGSIAITKNLTVPAEITTPFTMQFSAVCTWAPSGSQTFPTSITMTGSGTQTAHIADVPLGATCSVSETQPTAPVNYRWNTVTSQSITVSDAATPVPVSFANELTRGVGSLAITKQLTVPAEITTPFTMQFSAVCTWSPSGSQTFPASITMTGSGVQTAHIAGVPLGATCTVSETQPAAPANYHWNTVASQTVTVSDAATPAPVNFANELTRGVGSIAITKQLTVPAEITTAFTMQFSAACTWASSGSQTFPASITMTGSGVQTAHIAGVPLGATCTVSETQPAAPVNYHWNTVESQTVTVSDATTPAPVSFANALTRGRGSITISKTLKLPSGTGNGNAPAGPFVMQFAASCDVQGAAIAPVSLSMSASGVQSVDIPNVPAGAHCTVTEQLPEAPKGYTWAQPQITQPSAAVPDGGKTQADVVNELRAGTPATPTPVPTLGQWALMGLTLLLSMLGVGVLRQRQA